MICDVVIIGAGVIGSMTARELSKYKLKICILEKDSDAAMGASRANSGIVHAGYDARPGSLKARLNVLGNELMESAARELDVPFKRIGSLVVSFRGEDRRGLEALYERGIKNGVRGLRILDREEALMMEPNLPQEVEGALYAPTAGIICPYELTIGALENAITNGAELRLGSGVKRIERVDGLFRIQTDNGSIAARYVVNAAGVYADAISAMVGDDSFRIMPRKGEYLLFDKSQGGVVGKTIFQLPTDKGKGILVTPTVDGNLLIGPNANPADRRDDTATTAAGIEEIMLKALKSVPGIDMRQVITSFAGLRATSSTGDFVIGESPAVPRFVNVAGIESPGLAASPAIAQYVSGILADAGLDLIPKADYTPERRGIARFRDMSDEERKRLIKRNKAYGRIVCRCEKVTEGEVIDSIRRPAGARNLDAVKRRTRAGMGRCQGGFCSGRIMEILSKELGIPLDEVTKMGEGSNILAGRTK
jgi:glycerol-3-phosphate dehydrogenase